MSEPRIRQALDALDDEASPWWAWDLPDEGPTWPPPFADAPPYGVAGATGPVHAGTVRARLDAVQTRKRRMSAHGLVGLVALLLFSAAAAFDVQPLLGGEAIWALGGGALAALVFLPSFVRGYAREERRLTLYRLLAAHYEDA